MTPRQHFFLGVRVPWSPVAPVLAAVFPRRSSKGANGSVPFHFPVGSTQNLSFFYSCPDDFPHIPFSCPIRLRFFFPFISHTLEEGAQVSESPNGNQNGSEWFQKLFEQLSERAQRRLYQ